MNRAHRFVVGIGLLLIAGIGVVHAHYFDRINYEKMGIQIGIVVVVCLAFSVLCWEARAKGKGDS